MYIYSVPRISTISYWMFTPNIANFVNYDK